MYRVMLSYPLFGSGMRRLEQETDLFVTGCGELAPYEAQFLQADAFITRNVHPDKALIAKTTKLKVIGIPGVGYQGYDLEDLTNCGIALVYCPGMNGRSVAEHAMGLVYALTKQIVRDDREVKAGNYAIRNAFDHMELSGARAGIAGFGQIGRETAKLFRGSGMEVWIYDPFAKPEQAQALGCRYCETLDELLENVKILSLHMPSLSTTYHMFSAKEFARMPKGSYLINCARGSVVDETALYEALESGQLAGAGLDVMEHEPFDVGNPLLRLSNVIFTPHVAGVTAQASERTHALVVDSTLSLLKGKAVSNLANPDVLKHPRWTEVL